MGHDVVHFAFGVFGNINGLLLFLAPTITFMRIIKNKSTEQFSGIPYVMTLLSCLLFVWYGMPFVSEGNTLVLTINVTGAAVESIYVLIFLIYAPQKDKGKILGLLALGLSVVASVAFVSVFALHGEDRKLVSGFAACIFCIIMYASPLSVMRTVIKTKSVEYMPFSLSLFVFSGGTSWFIYGLRGNDHFLAVPNGLGCGLGAVQLILYAIYRDKKSETKKADVDGSSVMGLGNPDPEKQSDTQRLQNGHV
ncbi:bidirectional sugar transporter SWEET1 isoform X2 [Rhododendron vialii]|uniref:bidirectional sugar transporter SWEET1 isoform X2 n=1 Tax=Rhododendron vialii TaxID=182163 RepID=UPI00266052DF|nr:bidirectional sugar transporter SWEET1 isoform X2 [Rhododendron vialii]